MCAQARSRTYFIRRVCGFIGDGLPEVSRHDMRTSKPSTDCMILTSSSHAKRTTNTASSATQRNPTQVFSTLVIMRTSAEGCAPPSGKASYQSLHGLQGRPQGITAPPVRKLSLSWTPSLRYGSRHIRLDHESKHVGSFYKSPQSLQSGIAEASRAHPSASRRPDPSVSPVSTQLDLVKETSRKSSQRMSTPPSPTPLIGRDRATTNKRTH
jgi:hypothetical protein